MGRFLTNALRSMPRYIMETGKLSMVPPLKGPLIDNSTLVPVGGQCRGTASGVFFTSTLRWLLTLVSMSSGVPPGMPAMSEVAEVPAAESEVKE